MPDVLLYFDAVPQPDWNSSLRNVQIVTALGATAALNGDNVKLMTVPIGQKWRIHDVTQRLSGTLGASAVVQARINRAGVYTVLAAASTAGAASRTSSVAQQAVPFDANGGDTIELLVSGANFATAATATLDLTVSDR